MGRTKNVEFDWKKLRLGANKNNVKTVLKNVEWCKQKRRNGVDKRRIEVKTSNLKTVFDFQLSIRIKGSNDPSIAYYFGIHNRGSLIPNLSRMFGSEFLLVFASETEVIFATH